MKQMGKLDRVSAYNREFSKFLLQIPNMRSDEQIFLYSQGLKRHIRIEVERDNPETLQKAMNRLDPTALQIC